MRLSGAAWLCLLVAASASDEEPPEPAPADDEDMASLAQNLGGGSDVVPEGWVKDLANIMYKCGKEDCAPPDWLVKAQTWGQCDGKQHHKVTLLLTEGSNPEDGSFNDMAIMGGMRACNEANSCCLEVDIPISHTAVAADETNYFCEIDHAAVTSQLVIGVGWLQNTALHRGALCDAGTKFAGIDMSFNSIPNMNLEGVLFEDAQAGFLAGFLAGMVAGKTSSKIVGIISGPPNVPSVKRTTTGFTNAVAEVCADCTSVIAVCDWDRGGFASPNCGIETAKELIAGGASLIFNAAGWSGSVGIKYAASPFGTIFKEAVDTELNYVKKTEYVQPWVMGSLSDEFLTTFMAGSLPGADRLITSAVKKIDLGVATAIGNHFAGTAGGSNWLMEVMNGGIDLAPSHKAPIGLEGSIVTQEMFNTVFRIKGEMAVKLHDTRVSVTGECTKGPGPGCPLVPPPSPPGSDGNSDAVVVGAVVGSIGAALVLACGGFMVFMIIKEKSGTPVFTPLPTEKEVYRAEARAASQAGRKAPVIEATSASSGAGSSSAEIAESGTA